MLVIHFRMAVILFKRKSHICFLLYWSNVALISCKYRSYVDEHQVSDLAFLLGTLSHSFQKTCLYDSASCLKLQERRLLVIRSLKSSMVFWYFNMYHSNSNWWKVTDYLWGRKRENISSATGWNKDPMSCVRVLLPLSNHTLSYYTFFNRFLRRTWCDIKIFQHSVFFFFFIACCFFK